MPCHTSVLLSAAIPVHAGMAPGAPSGRDSAIKEVLPAGSLEAFASNQRSTRSVALADVGAHNIGECPSKLAHALVLALTLARTATMAHLNHLQEIVRDRVQEPEEAFSSADVSRAAAIGPLSRSP